MEIREEIIRLRLLSLQIRLFAYSSWRNMRAGLFILPGKCMFRFFPLPSGEWKLIEGILILEMVSTFCLSFPRSRTLISAKCRRLIPPGLTLRCSLMFWREEEKKKRRNITTKWEIFLFFPVMAGHCLGFCFHAENSPDSKCLLDYSPLKPGDLSFSSSFLTFQRRMGKSLPSGTATPAKDYLGSTTNAAAGAARHVEADWPYRSCLCGTESFHLSEENIQTGKLIRFGLVWLLFIAHQRVD